MTKMGANYILIFLSFIQYSHGLDPACDTTNQLDDWKRSVAYAPTPKDPEICDSFLAEGWYRITSKAGDKMPTVCPQLGFKCSTTSPIWLSNENVPPNEAIFPDRKKMVVNRIACSSYFDGDCCKEKLHIKIKNCGTYFAYYLTPPHSCNTAYCFDRNQTIKANPCRATDDSDSDKVPCPDGESSETGFQPGCGTFPQITVKPIVKPGMHVSHDNNGGINHNIEYSYETIKFECTAATLLPKYDCNVRWYINDFPIEVATRKHINANQLNQALLLQSDWENMFTPTMSVKCSLQIIDGANFPAPGPEQFSEVFTAGLVVHQKEFAVDEGKTTEVPVSLTIPIGCSYPTRLIQRQKDLIRTTSCVLNLITSVPTYQINPKLCEKQMDSITFRSQRCGIYFSNKHWNDEQKINVTGTVDGVVNMRDRMAVLRLYNDKRAATAVKELRIWKGITLPDIKFMVRDKDGKMLGKTCSSNNDPHMRTFDGNHFSFHQREGEYILYRHKRLPVQIHGYYRKCGSALCNCGAAVRSGDSVFVANFCIVKGRQNRYVTHKECKENELKVVENGGKNVYTVTAISGTQVIVNLDSRYVNSIVIKASELDKDQTEGVCGTLNGDRRDDLTPPGGLGPLAYGRADIIEALGAAWRVTTEDDSIFNIYRIKPIANHFEQYCTCKKQDRRYPFGPPEFNCDLKASLQICTEQTMKPKSVYQAPCRHNNFKTKRKRSVHSTEEVESIVHEDDDAPEMFLMDVNDGKESKVNMDWKNGWNEKKALDHCKSKFTASSAYTACTDYVPSVPSDKFIKECVKDIQIFGDTSWLEVSVKNFGSECLSEAARIENYTNTNSTDGNGDEKNIFSIIADSACPENCTGRGLCNKGECNCTEGFFGPSCDQSIHEAPELLPNAFDGLCDIRTKPCKKYVIPGLHFMEDGLTCKYRHYQFGLGKSDENETIEYVSGEYMSGFSMRCPAPLIRHKRSLKDTPHALGYFVSVSNDGKNFTEELPIIVYDSACLDCNVSSMTCNFVMTCPMFQKGGSEEKA